MTASAPSGDLSTARFGAVRVRLDADIVVADLEEMTTSNGLRS